MIPFKLIVSDMIKYKRPPNLQPKLKIGSPNDRSEQQADRVADSVMNMPDQPLQMQKIEDEEELQMQPMEKEEDGLQMKCETCEEEERLQMSKDSLSGYPVIAPATFSEEIAQSVSGGKSLPHQLNREMSQKIGSDFSDVSIHSDNQASEMSRQIGARAFTHGKDIYFNSGEYKPATSEGKHLLAHELVHTVQQSGKKRIQRVPTLGAAAPANANWRVVPNDQQDRVNAALTLIGRVVNNNRCKTYFEDTCSDGRGANSLQHAYDNAVVFNLNTNDSTYGSSINGTNNIAYNNTTYNTGRWYLASTLLHEMFHTCDPMVDPQDEIDAENAVEACRLYTPILRTVSPASASIGDPVTLRGVSFGASQGSDDKVYFNNLDSGVASKWGYTGTPGSSQGEIIVNVPAGATSGVIKVVNNGIASNEKPFSVLGVP